jgi:hypothetical protein
MSNLALRIHQAHQTMRATIDTPYFERARAALAALVDQAKRDAESRNGVSR